MRRRHRRGSGSSWALLGAEGAHGRPRIVGLEEALALPGVAVHLYGKASVRPFRKMGHVTVTSQDLEQAMAIARRVRGLLRIEGSETA